MMLGTNMQGEVFYKFAGKQLRYRYVYQQLNSFLPSNSLALFNKNINATVVRRLTMSKYQWVNSNRLADDARQDYQTIPLNKDPERNSKAKKVSIDWIRRFTESYVE